MKLESLLTLLLAVALVSGQLRTMVNWVLLNKVNGTSYPNLRNPRPVELIFTLGHLVTSSIKPWWRQDKYWPLVFTSNFLSVLLYASLAGFSICLVLFKTLPDV